MPKKRMKVPADYDRPDQSDSDDKEDSSYSQEDEDASRYKPSPKKRGVRTRQQRQKTNRGSSPETTQWGETAPPSPTSAPETALDRNVWCATSSQNRLATFHAAERLLNDKRNRITSPTPEEDDDEIYRLTELMHHESRSCDMEHKKA